MHYFPAEYIQILYGTHDTRELSNGTDLPVDAFRLMRLQFIASKSAVHDMSFDTSNVTMSFHRLIQDTNTTAVIYTHFLEVESSGSVTVHGLLVATNNTDYNLTIYFNGESS